MDLNEGRVVKNRLREVRRKEGRTVAWLAERIGTSPTNIYNLEQGRYRGSLETWLKIADALGVTIDALTEGMLEPAGKA